MSKKRRPRHPGGPPPDGDPVDEPVTTPALPLHLRVRRVALEGVVRALPEERHGVLDELIREALEGLEEVERSALEDAVTAAEPASDEAVEQVRRLLGTHALVRMTRAENRQAVRREISNRTAGLPPAEAERLYAAGLQNELGIPLEADSRLVQANVGDLMQTKEETAPMATQTQGFYDVDVTNLPPSFDKGAFIAAVESALSGMQINSNAQPVIEDALIGMLLLDGNTDPGAANFNAQITGRLWTYLQSPLLDSNSQQVLASDGKTQLYNRDAFSSVNDVITALRAGGNPPAAYYQELAYASRQIIDGNRGGIVPNNILLTSAVQSALQSYGSGTSSQGSFDLPPLTGPTAGGGTDEIIPDHIRAVAMHYAALQLEICGLFKVVDRNVEIFMNGQLPVNADQGGNALNAYYWDTINRMSESARWMQYTRILGAKGGEISKEVQPNTAFDDNFMRFLSALSEYDRQQRVADLLGNQRALSLTGEHVRKAGRDLASNSTLYGYGYSQFSAKKLMLHVQTALNILKLPDVQAAWGVQSAWQVVERVSAQEFHTNPNVVKYRTMAESGKKILDLVAQSAAAWNATTGNPLFQTPATVDGGASGYDIDPNTQAQFMRNTEYWLAVNGVKDQDVAQSAQPADTVGAPSIPSLDGSSGNGHSADITNQLQQMLNQGQTPSADQLRKLVGI